MSEKKGLFEVISPKSALILGSVAGLLTACTIGFVVLLFVFVGGRADAKKTPEVAATPSVQDNQPAQQPAQQAPVVQKSDRPKVELFIMSYCPYGLQMQKALVPAWELLKDRADISIKFVSYAMHGLKEVEENNRQFCIQSTQKDKYLAYTKCFTASDDYKACFKSAGINETTINNCVTATNEQFGTIKKYNDQATWLSGRYPLYPPHEALNQQYGVQGSPTLIINGTEVQGVSRSPEAVKQAICAAFNNAPSECQKTLDTAQAGPGIGTATGGAAPAAGCGT